MFSIFISFSDHNLLTKRFQARIHGHYKLNWACLYPVTLSLFSEDPAVSSETDACGTVTFLGVVSQALIVMTTQLQVPGWDFGPTTFSTLGSVNCFPRHFSSFNKWTTCHWRQGTKYLSIFFMLK